MNGHTPMHVSEQLIAALQSSGIPDSGDQPLTLIQTHLNWVLLSNGTAYKIKKPVNFGFVDFRTLALRRHACREELRLNKRLAPDIYRDIVAIYGSHENPSLEPSGRAIEYMLRMNEFPQNAMLASRFAENRVTEVHIERFAGMLAAFHQEIPRATGQDPWGTPNEVIRPIHDIIESLERLTAQEDQTAIRLIHQWIDGEFAHRRDLIRQRRDDGFVRECHGDLHLGNLVLIDDEIIAFDCIEFSEALRWIDVASEVAFLLMDLEEHRQCVAARLFLNRYLEVTGDYGLLACLDLYVVYRAIVRATVTRLQIQSSRQTDWERSELMGDVAAYIREAGQHIRRRKPRLWITHGCSGSGKSTGARELVRRAGAVQIRSDVERKRLALDLDGCNAGPNIRRSHNLYSAEMNQQTYHRLKSMAGNILRAGFPVVVDATFLTRQDRDQFRNLAAELTVPFGILDFSSPPAVLRERIRKRLEKGTDPSDATEDVLERQLHSQEPLDDAERAQVIAVDDVVAQ